MSKLFTLREWLYIEDAARVLTERFNEPVTVRDIFALALEGRLRLSVRFVKEAPMRLVIETAERPPGEYNRTHVVVFHGETILRLLTGVVAQDGVFDLSMRGGEREIVSARERADEDGNPADHWPSEHIILADTKGQLFLLLERKSELQRKSEFLRDSESWIDSWDDPRNYMFGFDFPPDVRFVVRTNAIREMEATLDQATPETPEDYRARVAAVVERHNGNYTRAAAELEISRQRVGQIVGGKAKKRALEAPQAQAQDPFGLAKKPTRTRGKR